jgi:hypothetical protein
MEERYQASVTRTDDTFVPQRTDPSGEWVWSIYDGIKKDFTVYKSIKGNTELLYNLFDQKDNSPYAQRFAVRFGFEFPMRKKAEESGPRRIHEKT